MKTNKLIAMAVVSVVTMTLFSCGTSDEKPNSENIDIVSSGTIKGDEVYKKNCVACHQSNGEGISKTFPPLAKSDFLPNREKVIEQVIKGKKGEMVVNGEKYNNMMPPQPLSDDEIAAVLTYVYCSWGNTGNKFTIDEVKAVRNKTQ